jgi:hypothetical protein
MARETVTAVLIQQQQQQIALTQMTFYHKMAVDYVLPIQKRVDIPRVENYYEVTIPRYSPDDFKSHFRLTRAVTVSRAISLKLSYNRHWHIR